MNARARQDAVEALFDLCTDEEIQNALEWVGNDMPLFFGSEDVGSAWFSKSGDP